LELFCLSENQGLTSFWEWDQGVGEGRGEEKKEGNGGNGGEKATRALQKGRFFLEGFVERRFRLGSGSMALEKKENTMGKERREERTKK